MNATTIRPAWLDEAVRLRQTGMSYSLIGARLSVTRQSVGKYLRIELGVYEPKIVPSAPPRRRENDPAINALFAQIKADYGVTRAQLRAPVRDYDTTMLRQEVMTALLLMGFSTAQTGRIMGRDHSTVSYSRQQIGASLVRSERARDMAAGYGYSLPPEHFTTRLRTKLATNEYDTAAILSFLALYVRGERSRVSGAVLAHGRYLVATRYARIVEACLIACGLGERWPVVAAQLRHEGRRAS